MTDTTGNLLLTSQDAYLRSIAEQPAWQLGTEKMALDISVGGDGVLTLDAWRLLPDGVSIVSKPHSPFRIAIDGQDETNRFHYERFAYGTDPDNSLFLDLWLRHTTRGLLAHLFMIVYPGTRFIASFIRLQNGTGEDVELSDLSSLYLELTSEPTSDSLAFERIIVLGNGSQDTITSATQQAPLRRRFEAAGSEMAQFFLLGLNKQYSLAGTIETIEAWAAELVEQVEQNESLHLEAALIANGILLPAQRGRYDGAQGLIGCIEARNKTAELSEFLNTYRIQ